MTRGEVWWADFGLPFGSEPGFRRPVMILQSDEFNRSAIRTVVIVPFSTNLGLEHAPGNVLIPKEVTKLPKDSVAVVSQIVALDRERLVGLVSTLTRPAVQEIEAGVQLVLGMRS